MKKVLGLALAGMLLAGAATAVADDSSPAGQWQSVDGETRYQVSMCGDGTALCVKLIWLRADLRTDDNLAYLNTWVVENARASDDNEWRGELEYDGATVSGQIRLVGDDRLEVSGCRMIVCQRLEFFRI